MITVLHGTSEFLRHERLRALVTSEDPNGLATTRFPAETSLATIAAAALTPSFFGERRLIIVESLVSTHRRGNRVASELLALLQAVPESCHLVSVESQLPQETARQLTESLGNTLRLIECTPPTGTKLVAWIRERALHYGVTMSQEAAEELVSAVAPGALRSPGREASSSPDHAPSVDLVRIDTELAKLATAVHPADVVTVEVVQELVAADEQGGDWELLDAIQAGHLDRIVRALERRLESGVPVELVLGQLASHCEVLFATAAVPFAPPVIAEATGIPLRRLLQARRDRSDRGDEAKDLLHALRSLDVGVKRGRVTDSDAALAALLVTHGQRARHRTGWRQRHDSR
ncbi:MAG: hypothetical protein RMH81_03120 [Thermomicrobium sp.]|nr:hypothetical protein [Thermomicrobium sp.]